MTFNIAILGASGAVGRIMLKILYDRDFPVKNIYPLSSKRSSGKEINFGKKKLKFINVENFDFSNVSIALFSAGSEISKKWAPIAGNNGCVVIDNTSCFRMEKDVPLIIPEINLNSLIKFKDRNLIANPNCSTIQMLLALKPLHDLVKIKRIVVSTYQSVSGAGKNAIDELYNQTKSILNKEEVKNNFFPVQIANNVIPHIDKFLENRYTKEEMKMVWETQKILNDKNILVNPTAVRIPVFYGHSEAVHLETNTKINQADAVKLMNDADGVEVIDGVDMGEYPTAVSDGSGTDPVYVGRIREDISHENGLNLWIVADNIRKGAALNTVQIAEILIEEYL